MAIIYFVILITSSTLKIMRQPGGLPPSREVRLQDTLLEGELEQIAFDIYSGDAGDLTKNIVRLELTFELRKAEAARSLAQLIKRKLAENDGRLVIADVDWALEEFHENELLGQQGGE